MKKFILKTLTLLIPILFLLISYEILLRNSNYPNIYSFKNNLVNNKPDAIVLGNSHALRGILAENLNFNAISLANVSQSLNIDVKWLEHTLKKNQLKFIILNFSIPTLTGNLFESEENWRVKNYNIYTDLQLGYKTSYNLELSNGKQIENLQKLIENKFNPFDVGILKNGSFPIDTTLSLESLKNQAVIASNRHVSKKNNIQNNINTLNKMVALSKKHNFDIIIVTPPSTKYYRELIPKNIEELMCNTLIDVDNKNSNVYWLNFYNDTTFNSNLFKDSDHLNLDGANELTKRINFFLNKIYFN